MELDLSKVIVRDVAYAIYGSFMRSGHYALMHKKRWADGIIFVMDGTATYTFADHSFSVKKNDMFYLANESQYDIDVGENYRVAYVDCTLEVPPEMRVDGVRFPLEESEDVDRLMARLERKWLENTDASRLQMMAAMYSLFSILVQHRNCGYLSTDNRNRVVRAGEMIEEHCSDKDFTCAGLGESIGMSEVHFRRLFARYYGMTPSQYLTAVRIRKARNMLMQGSLTISEISDLTGYHSVYYFCRAFKRETGYTPSEYRKKAL